MSNQIIELLNEELVLFPERALYWPRRQTLVLTDLHLGKAATFRAAAIPVPEEITLTDLGRLERLLAQTGAERLIILGDFLHAKSGRAEGTLAAVTAWRLGQPNLQISLVRGNHDRRAGDPPPEWNILCVDEPLPDPPFLWRHEPYESAEGYTIAGHLHPAVRLVGPGRQQETLPCFLIGPKRAILPAFGSFTGTAIVKSRAGDRVYVVAGDEVVSVP